MPDLAREPVAASIDGNGVSVRVVDVAGQFLVSGVEMPANTIEGDLPYSVWLAPGRRLTVGRAVADGEFVSDVGDGFIVIDISGPRADEILAMASPLDPAVLTSGRCAQTLFAGVKIVLYRHAGALRLHVERPLAAWLLDWLRQTIGAFEGSGT
jgi:heterotetrameric sarcosine oxidase gamma subunit